MFTTESMEFTEWNKHKASYKAVVRWKMPGICVGHFINKPPRDSA